MPTPSDQKLYDAVKAEADRKFLSKTSIYKSSWIVREYKKRGGKYKNNNRDKNKGLLRWYREEWVDLNRPIKNSRGTIIGYKECGRPSATTKGTYPLCRPVHRITAQTPTTIRELSPQDIEKAKNKKQRLKNNGSIGKIKQQ
jgi:Family of unknown function (DUF5872)